MANSAAPETHQAAQTQLAPGLSTPDDAGVDGASSESATVVPASPTGTTSTPDCCQAATSAGGSLDVFSSLSELSAALSGLASIWSPPRLDTLPSEVLALVASFLDVDDLLRISRVSASAPAVSSYRSGPGSLTAQTLYQTESAVEKIEQKIEQRREKGDHGGPNISYPLVVAVIRHFVGDASFS